MPVLNRLSSLKEEGDFVAREFAAFNKGGWPWREMAILYRTRFIGEEMTNRLRAVGIPIQWLGESKDKKDFKPSEDSVKIMTMHSSKGLEFPIVAIPGLGYMPFKDMDHREEAKLLYVAMTRAMEVLLMTFNKESDFVTRLQQARSQIAA